MPQDRVGPSKSRLTRLLESLGMVIPPETDELPPEMRAKYDEMALETQSQDPTWKKAGRGLFGAGMGLIEGMVGMEPNPTRRDVGDWTNLGTQGITGLAGLPFTAYKALRKVPLTHGTQRASFDKFNPEVYDKSDILGWMTHAAENPEYSGRYAMGKEKSSTHIPETGPFNLQGTDYRTGKAYTAAPRMIPIEPDAKNVLDLVDPNSDDISAALAAVDPKQRKTLIAKFKDARREVRAGKTPSTVDNYTVPPDKLANELGIDPRHIEHRGNELSYDELPTRVLSEKIRMTPEDFDRSQFDAIRYNDMQHKSWAFPKDTPLNTPAPPGGVGLPLNDPAKKIDIFKMPDDAPSTGFLEPTMDWEPPIKPVVNNKFQDYKPDETELHNFLGWKMDSSISESSGIYEGLEKAQKAKTLKSSDIQDLENLLAKEILDNPNDLPKIADAKKWIKKYKEKVIDIPSKIKIDQPAFGQGELEAIVAKLPDEFVKELIDIQKDFNIPSGKLVAAYKAAEKGISPKKFMADKEFNIKLQKFMGGEPTDWSPNKEMFDAQNPSTAVQTKKPNTFEMPAQSIDPLSEISKSKTMKELADMLDNGLISHAEYLDEINKLQKNKPKSVGSWVWNK